MGVKHGRPIRVELLQERLKELQIRNGRHFVSYFTSKGCTPSIGRSTIEKLRQAKGSVPVSDTKREELENLLGFAPDQLLQTSHDERRSCGSARRLRLIKRASDDGQYERVSREAMQLFHDIRHPETKTQRSSPRTMGKTLMLAARADMSLGRTFRANARLIESQKYLEQAPEQRTDDDHLHALIAECWHTRHSIARIRENFKKAREAIEEGLARVELISCERDRAKLEQWFEEDHCSLLANMGENKLSIQAQHRALRQVSRFSDYGDAIRPAPFFRSAEALCISANRLPPMQRKGRLNDAVDLLREGNQYVDPSTDRWAHLLRTKTLYLLMKASGELNECRNCLSRFFDHVNPNNANQIHHIRFVLQEIDQTPDLMSEPISEYLYHDLSTRDIAQDALVKHRLCQVSELVLRS